MFGTMKNINQGEGQNLSLRRFNKLATATTPLVPGVNPDGKSPTPTDILARIEEYGDWVPTYSTVADTNGDPIISQNTELLSDQAFETLDILTWGVLKGSTNLYYANKAANKAATASVILASDLDWIAANLANKNAQKLRELQKAGPNIDTHPIAPSYVLCAHPFVTRDLRSLGSSFIRVQQYARGADVANGETGTYEQMRCFETTQLVPTETSGAATANTILGSTFGITTNPTNSALFPVLIFGKDAYATLGLQGRGSIKTHIHQPGEAGAADALDRQGSMGWTAWHSAVITNNDWMALLWVLASDQ
jgi:N4-gp56 family major capsid protein